MSFFRAYGLTLATDLQLEGLPVADQAASPDLIVRVDRESIPPLHASHEEFFVGTILPDGRLGYAWHGYATFVFGVGDEMVAYPAAGASDHQVQQALFGVVIASWFTLRGHPALHGSAVAINGRAALILADSGTGKSTLAAALVANGGTLISDDVCVLEETASGFSILPEVPRIKLLADSAAALALEHDGLPAIPGEDTKRELRLPRVADGPVPLAALFAYQCGPAPSVSPMTGGEAFFALRGNTFGFRAERLLELLPDGFERTAAIVRSVPIHRLTRGTSLATLPDVVGLVMSRMEGAQ